MEYSFFCNCPGTPRWCPGTPSERRSVGEFALEKLAFRSLARPQAAFCGTTWAVTNILEGERAELVEHKVEPAAHMVTHGAGDAYSARRTFGLKPGCHIHAVAMQICAFGNHVADVDANSKPNELVGELIAIVVGHLLLHFDRTLHGPVDAIEHDEQ